jgi:hypothetical protein
MGVECWHKPILAKKLVAKTLGRCKKTWVSSRVHWMSNNRTLKNTAIKIVIKYTPNCKILATSHLRQRYYDIIWYSMKTLLGENKLLAIVVIQLKIISPLTLKTSFLGERIVPHWNHNGNKSHNIEQWIRLIFVYKTSELKLYVTNLFALVYSFCSSNLS